MNRDNGWQSRYPRRLAVIDAVIILWATTGALVVRFGLVESDADPLVTYALLTVVLSIAWWLMLAAWGTRNPRVLGAGPEEFKSVFAASLWLFGLVAILSYAFKYDTARGYVGLALPAGVIGLLAGRWFVRQLLRIERRKGLSSSNVLVVGDPESVDHLVTSLRKTPNAGYKPVAAYLIGQGSNPPGAGLAVPIAGRKPEVGRILEAIERSSADSVAISSGSNLPPRVLRQLGWELAARDIRMILAPALTDVAGPRIHTQPVAGLPLVHVSTPKLTGGKRVAKRLFDVLASGMLILVLSPLLLTIAVLVKITSPGTILYSQERIGVRRTTFRMLKFRSMHSDADAKLQELLEGQGTSGMPLFKVENDPRITPLGKVLRKYSLDELPQLFNVLSGSMSLVGPRPQREGEVALYDDAAHRRLYVSPGMSGLWQVSGRSRLSWEEAIQLDLYYVENWSLTQDLVILFRTFSAVFTGRGAS